MYAKGTPVDGVRVPLKKRVGRGARDRMPLRCEGNRKVVEGACEPAIIEVEDREALADPEKISEMKVCMNENGSRCGRFEVGEALEGLGEAGGRNGIEALPSSGIVGRKPIPTKPIGGPMRAGFGNPGWHRPRGVVKDPSRLSELGKKAFVGHGLPPLEPGVENRRRVLELTKRSGQEDVTGAGGHRSWAKESRRKKVEEPKLPANRRNRVVVGRCQPKAVALAAQSDAEHRVPPVANAADFIGDDGPSPPKGIEGSVP